MPLGWTIRRAHRGDESLMANHACAAPRARAHGLFVCAGRHRTAGENVFNAAVLIDSAGKVISHHRKIHELDIGKDLYARGDCLSVADTRSDEWA